METIASEAEASGPFRAIVMQAPEAIVFADAKGDIRVWNSGAEHLFGFSAAEALGCSLDLIIPERFRQAHWNGYRKAMDAGRTSGGDRVRTTRSIHKDGRTLYVDLSFAVITDEAGAALGALSIGRDCTARFLAERASRASRTESEHADQRADPRAESERPDQRDDPRIMSKNS
jgi:PAS domain S-box-containing protein